LEALVEWIALRNASLVLLPAENGVPALAGGSADQARKEKHG
jgi:hypothetical protein